ncbi:D-sedoheptulose 7-phosphate isomerase [Campylobacter curvus]|uniref:D-sedoheptulose 7-phosphate isomerase n=1 Tax=Campylobacter curvus TaxID=200 RepID=UPI000362E782|nr:D-sedoheptulose 7-phosphate isomerase [Campylobacter curvus]QKF61587.1 sedoheptulose 7-phosphate isomerase [Campylobacter curvus]UEB49892.1 D-sedoheptulose 7-phosphate isomerase [Campylobacter curvus]
MLINEMIKNEFNAHLQTLNETAKMSEQLQKACEMVVGALKNGGKILICGNGGSAADAQHFAAELTGRYKSERKPLAGIALTTDTSALTAIGNDYGYDTVFSRQLEALAREGDLLVAISTSGNSKNVLNALEVAKRLGVTTLGFSGKGGGAMNEKCDLNLVVPASDTARIQEMHIFFVHTICQAVDMAY